MVPHDPASLGAEAVCLQSLQSGSQRAPQQHAVSDVFPTAASPDEGTLLPMPGVRLHDVAMGNQGSAPVGAAEGILWLGRHALHVYRAVMGSRGAWRRSGC